MTPKMTRAEFMAAVYKARPAGEWAALTHEARIANLAEKAGVEWLPDLIDPVVGEEFTSMTRRVEFMILTDDAGLAWQLRSDEGTGADGEKSWRLWPTHRGGPEFTGRAYGMTIEVVPDGPDPVPEPVKHETTVMRDFGEYRWSCTCGTAEGGYTTHELADRISDAHEAAHRGDSQ